MKILIASLLVLAIIAFILGYFRNRKIQRLIDKGELDRFPEVKEVDEECCGAHTVCERDSLLAGMSQNIEYYDDEQLDHWAGIGEEEYTDEQEEEFREIFYTMKESDVAGWIRSLQLRGIHLPLDMKEEVLMVITERRTN